MKYRPFGKTGVDVSVIGFGGWALGSHWGLQPESDSIQALNTAIDLGINFIDTAIAYGDGKSEKVIGRVLRDRTKEIFVASKIPPKPGPWPPSPYCSAEERFPEKYIRESVESTLKNLQRDFIDVMQIHTWTRAWNRDPFPLRILRELKKEGKVRFIGVSTPEHDQNALVGLMEDGWVDAVQVIYNIFEQEPAAELLPVAQENGIGVIVRMPFDEGVLTGKYSRDHKFSPDDFRTRYFAGDRLERAVERTEKIRQETADSGFTLPQLAIQFSGHHPAVSTVIGGIRNVDQAQKNAEVAELPDLNPELILKLHKHAWLKAFWYAGK
ncbi:MAG: aldo/keto reductase [Cyclobacteriaceae bacterium]|nr:aldo/keto reductase [Cyclobacteriaceae bacterium]